MQPPPTSPSLPAVRVRSGVSAGAIVLAGALPILFLHADYQPTVVLGMGSTDVAVRLSDVAVLAVVVAALAALPAHRGRLRAARWAWVAGGAYLAWVVASTVARAGTAGYPAGANLVTAAKLCETALLAPALPLLLRSRRDLGVVAVAVTAWIAAAGVVGVLQLVGVDMLEAWTAWRRQPSFVGHHDLAAIAVLPLAAGSAWLLLGRSGGIPSRLGRAGALVGAVALVVSGTVVGAAGYALGAIAVALIAWRWSGTSVVAVARLAALVVVVAVGVLAFRGGDVLDFARFLGIGPAEEKTSDVQSYSHRSVLAYIGVRIFLDHPLTGIGWQASGSERGYGPYLADARARFPTVADEAFPGPGHEWGVQNAYVQSAADTGAPGALLFLAVLAAPVMLSARTLRRRAGPDVSLGLAVVIISASVAGLWFAIGLVAGTPLGAVTWLVLGLGAISADRRAAAGG